MRLWVGLGCLVAALACGVMLREIGNRKLMPLEMAVSLPGGTIQSPQFQTDFNATYTIWLEANRAMGPHSLDCLLGGAASEPASCKETPGTVRIVWTVTSENQTVARGNSVEIGALSSAAVEGRERRGIGRFSGEQGRRYSFSAQIQGNPAEIAAIQNAVPRIVVNADPATMEKHAVSMLPWLAGAVGFGVAGLWLLGEILRSKQKKAMPG